MLPNQCKGVFKSMRISPEVSAVEETNPTPTLNSGNASIDLGYLIQESA